MVIPKPISPLPFYPGNPANRARTGARRHAQSGSLITEAIVAIAIFSIAALPLMSSIVFVQKHLRGSYQHAVAMEAVDGEFEILLAGEWHEYQPGAQPYELHGEAVKNLPPGRAALTINGRHVRLEWTPGHGSGKVVREADVR
jgi:hypothetical protein